MPHLTDLLAMSLIWYIFSNDVVSGPFSTENIENGLAKNKWSIDSLIWWKGQPEWVPVEKWKLDLKNILEGFRTNIQTTAWYVDHLGTQRGPMYSKDLQNFIQANGIVGTCRVWTEGMDRWMNVYEITELVQYFGITRRKYPRAPIKANVVIKKDDTENSVTGNAMSISTGGLGVRTIDALKRGDSISVMLKTPLLVQEVSATAKVLYTSENGLTGLEFTNLLSEYESIIKDYVNQFK